MDKVVNMTEEDRKTREETQQILKDLEEQKMLNDKFNELRKEYKEKKKKGTDPDFGSINKGDGAKEGGGDPRAAVARQLLQAMIGSIVEDEEEEDEKEEEERRRMREQQYYYDRYDSDDAYFDEEDYENEEDYNQ